MIGVSEKPVNPFDTTKLISEFKAAYGENVNHVVYDAISEDAALNAYQKAYGERADELVQTVPRSMFDGMDVEVGMSFRATTPQGEQSVIIIETTDEEVVVDGNHPLAGIPLTFDVTVVDVREATKEELEHGHVHSEGGCGHDH